MCIFLEGGGDIAGHREVANASLVVPEAGDPTVQCCFPINGHSLIITSEEGQEMVGVFLSNILDCEVIHNKGEFDEAFRMAPEARCVAALKVTMFGQAFGKELIGKNASLGQTVHSFVNAYVYVFLVNKGK